MLASLSWVAGALVEGIESPSCWLYFFAAVFWCISNAVAFTTYLGKAIEAKEGASGIQMAEEGKAEP